MNIPDAAIEAGADVARTLRADPRKYPTNALLARSVIEAAMPAIREALAQEIEADPAGATYITHRHAARIVRGGTP